MKVDAICVWGDVEIKQDLLDDLREKYGVDQRSLYVSYHTDLWKSLWLVNAKKRMHEVEQRALYKCVAYVYSLYVNIAMTTAKVADFKPDILYYVYGEYKWHTGIFPRIYYCDSMTGDLAANYVTNRGLIPGTQHDFYYHLKTYRIRTDCVDEHDRRFFKCE